MLTGESSEDVNEDLSVVPFVDEHTIEPELVQLGNGGA
jgi:hypothetical protein